MEFLPRIYFEDCGKGECILFLHGWGSSHADFLGTARTASMCFRTINIDLWGFGKSNLPPDVWGSLEYAKKVVDFLKSKKIKKVHLVGHSFGGKIATKICVNHPNMVKSLILVDSAGIIKRKSLKEKIKIRRYKKLKKLVMLGKKDECVLEKFGSSDYKNSSNIMRKILVKIVNENLESDFKNIKTRTLIVWGKQDKTTPLKMGKKINKLILGSKLVVFNGGHFAHVDNFKEFNNLCFDFWRSIWLIFLILPIIIFI